MGDLDDHFFTIAKMGRGEYGFWIAQAHTRAGLFVGQAFGKSPMESLTCAEMCLEETRSWDQNANDFGEEWLETRVKSVRDFLDSVEIYAGASERERLNALYMLSLMDREE